MSDFVNKNRLAYILKLLWCVRLKPLCSESSSSSTTSTSGGISWDWGNILNSTDLETVSGKGSDGGLGTWTWGLGVNTTSSSELDVNGVNSDILKELDNIHGGEHS